MAGSVAAEKEISRTIAAAHNTQLSITPGEKGPLSGIGDDSCGLDMEGGLAPLGVGNKDFICQDANVALCRSVVPCIGHAGTKLARLNSISSSLRDGMRNREFGQPYNERCQSSSAQRSSDPILSSVHFPQSRYGLVTYNSALAEIFHGVVVRSYRGEGFQYLEPRRKSGVSPAVNFRCPLMMGIVGSRTYKPNSVRGIAPA